MCTAHQISKFVLDAAHQRPGRELDRTDAAMTDHVTGVKFTDGSGLRL